jgi:class 3 adenylate cyclase
MADINRMGRTWLCSVVFTDIADYSSQSVELQLKWKARFNGYLASAIQDVPEDERVILDTGDGAAICFLGAPEAAMFAALELWHSLLLDEREQQSRLRVRIGINLGPVKLVRDINGAPNAIGDGMNSGQRIMSFAGENQILVSQSYFEVVSCLSDDYKTLFKLKGVEKDKHVREHIVYKLSPPGAEQGQVSVAPQFVNPQQPIPVGPSVSDVPSPPDKVAETARANHPENTARVSRSIPLLVGGIALVVIAGWGVWHFFGPAVPANRSLNTSPAGQGEIRASSQAIAPSVAAPATPSAPMSRPDVVTSTPKSTSRDEPADPDKSGRVRREAVVTAPGKRPANPAEAPEPTPVIQPTTVTVSDALPFTLALAEDVPSDALEGQALRFTVSEGLQIGDKTVIAKGATVTGAVASEAKKKKFLGIGGGGHKLTFSLTEAEAVDGSKLAVRALAGKSEDGPAIRPFDTSKGSKTKGYAALQGTAYIGYIDGDQTVSLRVPDVTQRSTPK